MVVLIRLRLTFYPGQILCFSFADMLVFGLKPMTDPLLLVRFGEPLAATKAFMR